MALDHKLAAAFIGNPKHRVLGVRLRPFCLWHLLLLQALDSPFLRKGDVHRFDLRTAAGICRLRFNNSRIVRPVWWPRSLRQACDGFLDYMGDFIDRPDYCVIPRDGGGIPRTPRGSAPETIRVASDIIGWAHWPERVVWELPLGKAYWYQSMALRAQGADVDFLTPEERAFQDEMEAAEQKKKKP